VQFIEVERKQMYIFNLMRIKEKRGENIGRAKRRSRFSRKEQIPIFAISKFSNS